MKIVFKIGRSPPGNSIMDPKKDEIQRIMQSIMDPKKDDKDEKKKNSDKEGFDIYNKIDILFLTFVWLFYTFIVSSTCDVLSYLYENVGFYLREQSTMNAFLNVS